ncbi:MAG: hypothetical protein ACRCZF_10355, partial [Gemmataceae bacterium]
EARTSYDVDVVTIRTNDSYASISKKILGDERYAEAIKAYNRGIALNQGNSIDVPPIYILRKDFGNLINRTVIPERAEWNAPGTNSPVRRPVPGDAPLTKTYIVPAGGITIEGIAKLAYGDEREWSRIWNLNAKFSPREVLEEGQRIKVPEDSRVGK